MDESEHSKQGMQKQEVTLAPLKSDELPDQALSPSTDATERSKNILSMIRPHYMARIEKENEEEKKMTE